MSEDKTMTDEECIAHVRKFCAPRRESIVTMMGTLSPLDANEIADRLEMAKGREKDLLIAFGHIESENARLLKNWDRLKNRIGVLIAFDEQTMVKPESDTIWFDGRIAGYQNLAAIMDRIERGE